MMHLNLIAQMYFLLIVANGAPILLWRILGDTASFPVDCGLRLADGHRLLGSSKTIRGVLASLAVTASLAPAINVSWSIGLAIACLAMTGDLISSFLKRRMGLAPSSRFTVLDQIPESLIPALAGTRVMGLSLLDVIIVVTLFFISVIFLSGLLYKMTVRRRPY